MQTPPLTGLLRELEEASELDRFWADHWSEYLERYPDQFVAVRDGEVLVAASDLEALVDRLNGLGLDPEADVAIEFIRTHPDALIL